MNITTSSSNNTHKEYGEENASTIPTICTQCHKIITPLTTTANKENDKNNNNNNNNNNYGITIRKSDDGSGFVVGKLQTSQSTPNLSHGLCGTCFNNLNTDLLTSASASASANIAININNNNKNNNNGSQKALLSKSLSSPQFSRHLPSRPKRVLIVDDNKLQRQIHRRMIEHAGYDCDVAFSGAHALELVQKHSYSFIFMDLIMSPMDGWTTSKKIKLFLLQSLGFSSSSPKIIAVTGLNVDEKIKEQCREAGMEDVLHKPVSSEMLNKVLHKHTISPDR